MNDFFAFVCPDVGGCENLLENFRAEYRIGNVFAEQIHELGFA